ncbi:MAG: IS110 family transposase [bacterium]|nr:IS110 family transposase [bacterium]
MGLFVGIDWGSRVHAVCVLDGSGKLLHEGEVAHDGEAVIGFVQKIRRLAGGDLSAVRAAMESPHGTMIEALVDSGASAYHLNPKQLDRFRDRRSVAGAKDDDLDAWVLADSLRTDTKLFREVPLLGEHTQALRATSRTYKSLTVQALGVASQIREHLQRYFPQLLSLGRLHNERWLWELIRAAPTPAKAAKLRPCRVRAILTRRNIRRHDADTIVQRLRATPIPVAPGVADAAAESVLTLLPVLEVLYQQSLVCLARLEALMLPTESGEKEQSDGRREGTAESQSHKAMLRDAALLQTLPGIGIRTGAVVLAEGHVALQARDYRAFRRLSGVAPVSRRTGGKARKPMVSMRRARNSSLAAAVHLWGEIAVRHDEHSKAHYARLRAAGHNHARSVRGVTDRLCKVAIGMLKSGQPYDPKRRLGPSRTAEDSS